MHRAMTSLSSGGHHVRIVPEQIVSPVQDFPRKDKVSKPFSITRHHHHVVKITEQSRFHAERWARENINFIARSREHK